MKPYDVVTAETALELEQLVSANLSKGYVCQGGVSCTLFGYRAVMMQAMILKPSAETDLVKVEASPHA